MKLGGIGAVDLISRTEQTKAGTPAQDTGAKAQASSLLSSAATSKASKPAVRSSISSKENTKDFSTVLDEASEGPPRKVENKTDANQESLALAANSQGVTPQREPRPTTTPDVREAADVATEPSVKIGTEIPVDAKAGDRAGIAAAVEPGSIEEKINDIVESLEETSGTELSMRHLSMRDFLSKMKEEFGIEPKAIVNAFAKLDAQALQAAPEQTASAVLSQLALKPEQMPKAERFYREMLNQTGESALNETFAGVGAGITLKVLSEQDVAMDKLQRSILTLNDAFARRDEPAKPSVPLQTAIASAAALKIASAASPSTAAPTSASSTASTPEQAVASASKLATMLQMAVDNSGAAVTEPVLKATENLDPIKTEEAPAGGTSKFASIGAALSAAAGGLGGQNSSGTGGQGSNSNENSENSKNSKAKDAATEAVSKPRAFDSIESALAPGLDVANMGGERAAIPLAAGSATSAALASTLANQEGDGATNAQDIVRHAQILVKNGGGEMKMQLKPEGVGDVTLKVAVKDGQVQIQMMTETDSAKRVLESNLDDLKTSLAQNKLHIDAVKIEVGGDMAKQRFEQAQQDANREQTRQMAQDFMSQFRNDREGFRQSFGDMSGFRNYQQPKKNPAPEIEPVVAASVSKVKSSGDRRLNLVA